MLVDDLLAHPETKPGSDRTLRREERLEDMLPQAPVDAFAVVGYRNPDAAVSIPKGCAGRHPRFVGPRLGRFCWVPPPGAGGPA